MDAVSGQLSFEVVRALFLYSDSTHEKAKPQLAEGNCEQHPDHAHRAAILTFAEPSYNRLIAVLQQLPTSMQMEGRSALEAVP